MRKREDGDGRNGADPEEQEQNRLFSEKPEEDDWLDEEESEGAEEDDWLDEEESEGAEEDDWLDEEASEGAEEDDWLDEEESEGAEEDDWLDEEESEDAEEDDWLDDEASEDAEEDDWLDDEESEDAEETGRSGDGTPAAGDAEGAELADILAAGMREEPVSAAADTPQEAPTAGTTQEAPPSETPQGAPASEKTPPPATEEDLDWNGDWYEADAERDADTEDAEAPSEDGKKHRRGWIAAVIIVAAIVAAYLYFGFYFRDHFLPNTSISGIDCSYMTEEEVADAIQAEIDRYELQLLERNDEEETIYGKEIDLHVAQDNTLSDILAEQGAFQWPKAYFAESVYNPGRTMEWDEDELTAAIDALNCMDESQMIDPEDAAIVYDEEKEAFVVQPAIYGTHIRSGDLTSVITRAISSLADYVNLDETGCYETPNVTEESSQMVAACEQMNVMLSADITYDMIDVENIHISKDQIKSWISIGSDLEPSYDEEAIRAFIAEIAEEYDTRGKPHSLETSWGTTVTVSSGTYGWELDQDGEYEQLIADLASGETVTREPVWAHSANSHGENDYGNTYVEANLTKQHLYFYKGGTLIIDTDFVSGRMTTSRVTHDGIYYVYYKQSPAVLKGEDYESPVTYWMPFNGGEGLHDATWRGSFGGTIYMYGGSHGCLNLPYSAAEIIYNNISVGDCVFVYWEDGRTMDLVKDS